MARHVNDTKPKIVIENIITQARKLETNKIVCLGATFKADIDDLRESPALKIIIELSSLGYEVQVVEPNIKNPPHTWIDKQIQLVSLDSVFEDAQDKIFALLVGHREFKTHAGLCSNIVLDFCGAMVND